LPPFSELLWQSRALEILAMRPSQKIDGLAADMILSSYFSIVADPGGSWSVDASDNVITLEALLPAPLPVRKKCRC
jgi:hypothetical protein